VIQTKPMRIASTLLLCVMASGLTGCFSSDKFQVRIEIDEKDRATFRAPAMVVYVMLCDKSHPAPVFPEKEQSSIEAWVVDDPGNHYAALTHTDPVRAKQFNVTPSSDDKYVIEFEADDDMRVTGEGSVVAIALFGDTSNYGEHYAIIKLSDNPDREVFAFKLNQNSLKFDPEFVPPEEE
jgi:hypothetical protein